MLYMFVVGLLGVFFNFCTIFFKFRPKSIVPEDFLENYLKEHPLDEDKEKEYFKSKRDNEETSSLQSY